MADRWAVSFGALGEDEHGPYLEVRPQVGVPTSPERVGAVWRKAAALSRSLEAEVAEAAVYALELALAPVEAS
jgi:hypothetical protein